MSAEIKRELEETRQKSKISGGLFDIAGKEKTAAEYEEQMSAPDFWNDMEKAQKLSQKLAPIKKVIDEMKELEGAWQDADTAYELSEEERSTKRNVKSCWRPCRKS